MTIDSRYMFGVPGTFDPSEDWPSNEATLHEGGLDHIDTAYDKLRANLTGGIGFDPADYGPSVKSQEDVESGLPQWGPPFIAFVDQRMTQLEKAVQKAMEVWSLKTQTFIDQNSFQTDGSGNVGSNPANAPILIASNPGWTYAIHRLIILLDGATFGAPFTGAGDFWELRINGETVDGGSLVSGQGSLPLVKTYGTRDALRVRDGENLTFFAQGLTANKRMTVKIQSSVDRTIEG